MPMRVTLPDGSPSDPQSGVTPIMVQEEHGLYRVVGTGFYITRYGLLLTAKHVVEDMIEADGIGRPTLAWNWTSDGRLFMKPVLTCSFFPGAPRDAPDIAVCQAVDSVKGENVVINTRTERVGLMPAIPERNALIGTYAYPGNVSLDFRTGTPVRNSQICLRVACSMCSDHKSDSCAMNTSRPQLMFAQEQVAAPFFIRVAMPVQSTVGDGT